MTPRNSPPRATFQEQVLEQLGRDICCGRYPPGVVLPSESELCERFGFSRIVIREAIKALVAKEMLEVNRRIGTLVLAPTRWILFDPDVIAWRAGSADFDVAMARDMMELRRIVEPAADVGRPCSAGKRRSNLASHSCRLCSHSQSTRGSR
jgi:GntR family galactonate operon transcriptional repressor